MQNTLQFCVYKITNSISGKSYIGKTKDLKNRWKDHLRKSKKLNTKFPNALEKYPENSWSISILYETDDETHSYEVEELLINEYNTFYNGYNSCGGGIGTSSGKNNPMFGKRWTLSQEQKDAKTGKNSPLFGTTWSKERKNTKIGKNNPMFGKMPWEIPNCKTRGLEINWFYLDKVYELRTEYGYGQTKIYNILVKDYPKIKKSLTSFQSMFTWIKKNGNPSNNPDWMNFHNSYILVC